MKIRLKKFKSVNSTNDIAIKLIRKNNVRPTVVVSEKQTSGKGTMGKKWVSIKGNLFITIFFKLDQLKIDFKQFAIINALIIKRIISKKVSKEFKVKWPNDILYKKRKLCGILQEVIYHKRINYLIVGIGLNTNIAPKNKKFASTSLKNIIKKKIDNKLILKSIVKGYEKLLDETKIMSFEKLKKRYA